MTNAFLGRGWKLPLGLDDDGGIGMIQAEDSIRQAIWVILATAPGERVMRPGFGCGIHDLVFEVNNAGTAGRVATEVREALVKWEPRITVEHVDANADPEQLERLNIEIEYTVRATNSRFNLVYPFYLE